MADPVQALQTEIRRLRDLIERQFVDNSRLQSELRMKGDSAEIVEIGWHAPNPPGRRLASRPLEKPPEEAWPSGVGKPAPLKPSPGFASYALGLGSAKAIGVAVCGLQPNLIESVVTLVQERQRRGRDFLVLFLTDSPHSEIFRRRGYTFEVLPLLAPVDAEEAQLCRVYGERRIELLKRKWGLAGITNFGSAPYYISAATPGEGGADAHLEQSLLGTPAPAFS